MHRSPLILPALAALVATAVIGLPSPAGAAGGLQASMSAPTHRPKAGHLWKVSFRASYNGRPARVRLSYEYLYKGQVVGRANPDSLARSGYRFTGHYTDPAFIWPARSAGIPLTFRAVLASPYGTRRLTYWIVVRR